MNNPDSDDFSKITGSLVVSINVQGPGDEATELKMGTPKDAEAKPPIMPASAKREYKQLYFRLYRGTDLPKLDFQLIGQGTIDAYVKILYRGQKLKTKVIKQEENKVDWMAECLIPVPVPSSHNKLELQIWDEDNLVDEKAASVDMNIKEMLQYDMSRPSNTRSNW